MIYLGETAFAYTTGLSFVCWKSGVPLKSTTDTAFEGITPIPAAILSGC